MTDSNQTRNRVREFRTSSGLTQAGLAERAGVSRTAVTAIEGERLVPSVAAALALAEALETTVEVLFGRGCKSDRPAVWAWDPHLSTQNYWQAEVGGQHWLYPAESAPMLTPLPDGRSQGESSASLLASAARQTLVIACCDPAAGLLASEYAHAASQRMLVLNRSSRQALELLRAGKVHLAGLHLATPEDTERNAKVVRETLGSDYHLLRVAQWQEGIAAASSSRIKSVREAVRSKLRWVGREPGSGARQCLDHLLGDRSTPRRLARNHRGVAEAVCSGWADAGVCVQLVSAEAGLLFLPVQEEAYDLCIPNVFLDDPRVQALLKIVRSSNYRQTLANLPGYSTAQTGNLVGVN
ncbi:MAG TPA: substrate-binding domain-containing protein [Planctomycetaceae bacterium]|nr:substrate-binding domain-containing protein [Planctomycetaceae bacterium]